MTDRRTHPESRLSAFLDDELPEAESLAVARHVAACATCQRELDDLRMARAALRDLPAVPPPATLFADVLECARDADDAGRLTRTAMLAAAGVIGVLLVAFAAGGDDDGEVVPPVEVIVVDHVARTGGGPVIAPVDLGR